MVVTHHGRERLVALSMEKYQALVGGGAGGGAHGDSGMRLATVLERIGQGFLAIDPALRIVEANPVACAYLRATRDMLIGQPLADAHPDFARSLLFANMTRAAHAGEVAAFDAPSLGYPGNRLHFQTFPYGGGAACLFRNITGEVEARHLGAASAAMDRAMAAHGQIGCGRLSARATFTHVDRPLAAMAGFDPDSLLGVRLTDILPLNRRVEVGDEVEAQFAGGGPRAFDSALMVNKGGELPVRVALAGIENDYAGEGAVVLISTR